MGNLTINRPSSIATLSHQRVGGMVPNPQWVIYGTATIEMIRFKATRSPDDPRILDVLFCLEDHFGWLGQMKSQQNMCFLVGDMILDD